MGMLKIDFKSLVQVFDKIKRFPLTVGASDGGAIAVKNTVVIAAA